MGLLKFLFYRKKKEKEDLPLIARVRLRTEEEIDKSIEDYINNNDVCLLGARKYKPICNEDDRLDNHSNGQEL